MSVHSHLAHLAHLAHLRTLVVLLASLTLSVYAADQTLCPIMIEDEVDKEEFVEYQGQKIYMCCGSCTKAWETNPDYYAALAVALNADKPLLPQLKDVKIPEVKLMKQRFCPLRKTAVVGPSSPSIEYEGKKIYFFKERDIKRKWAKDPAAKFKEARDAGLLPQFDEAK